MNKLIVVIIFATLFLACQKQQLELAEVDPPRQKIEYKQEVIMNGATKK